MSVVTFELFSRTQSDLFRAHSQIHPIIVWDFCIHSPNSNSLRFNLWERRVRDIFSLFSVKAFRIFSNKLSLNIRLLCLHRLSHFLSFLTCLFFFDWEMLRIILRHLGLTVQKMQNNCLWNISENETGIPIHKNLLKASWEIVQHS